MLLCGAFKPVEGRPDRRLPPETDELPDAHQDLRLRAALLPRPADPAGRVRNRVSLGTVGRAWRNDQGQGIHSGRRTYFLHGRTTGGRNPSVPATRVKGSPNPGPFPIQSQTRSTRLGFIKIRWIDWTMGKGGRGPSPFGARG